MVEQQTDNACDEGKTTTTTPGCLPLLIFQHKSGDLRIQQDNGGDGDDGDDEMLMYSVSQKTLLHTNDLERDLVANKNMCWTAPEGWMLVKAPSAAAWLWNPSTGDKVALPDVGEEHNDDIPRDCKCLLTYKDATHPGCHVVLFDFLEPHMWYCPVAAGQ